MKTASVKATASQTRPFTGAEYLESLKDDREVWIYGKRVKDVTKHPAFRNSARSIARLYDALHDPAQRAVLTIETDTGNGGFTHPFYRAPRCREDLVAAREAIAQWQRFTFGYMGRTPDYKASFLATLGVNDEFYNPYHENVRRWYCKAQERVLFLNHAIVHPPVDRTRPADEIADICVHVEKETDAGVIVSGAKVVATGSALTHYNFVAHYGLPLKKDDSVTPSQIQQAMARIWDGDKSPVPPAAERTDVRRPKTHGNRPFGEYAETHHTEGKPGEVIELYRGLDRFCQDLAPGRVNRAYN